MLQIEPAAILWLAFLLLVIPANWLLAAVLAAGFHELCHILCLLLLQGRIYRVYVQWNGCVIEAEQLGEIGRFLSILAGPLGSLSLVFLGSFAPKVTVCGLIQGLYNLIPLKNLDGGRLLREVLCLLFPERTEAILEGIEILVRIVILVLILVMMRFGLLNPLVGLLLIIWNIRTTMRKFPCKPGRIRVQ